jgi:hypothetical protein
MTPRLTDRQSQCDFDICPFSKELVEFREASRQDMSLGAEELN